MGVEEPHLAAGLLVLQLDHRAPDHLAVEVGDGDAVGLDQLPGVGPPRDRVADRAAVEAGPGVEVPAGAGQRAEPGVLRVLELLEADHVEVGLVDQRPGHAHPGRAGGVAPLVAAEARRVRAAEQVEGADPEGRLVGEAAAQPRQRPLELLGVLDVLRRYVGDDLGRLVGGGARGLVADRTGRRGCSPTAPASAARSWPLLASSSWGPIMPVAPPTKSATKVTTSAVVAATLSWPRRRDRGIACFDTAPPRHLFAATRPGPRTTKSLS